MSLPLDLSHSYRIDYSAKLTNSVYENFLMFILCRFFPEKIKGDILGVDYGGTWLYD
jgi:hypothetical protein